MRLSAMEVARNEMGANQAGLDLSLVDGMAAAAQDSMRTGLTAAIDRGIDNLFDTSEKITPAEANERFGLTDTEAAIQPDEEVTLADVEARAKDFHNLKLNSFIHETVNEDSPVMGRVSQFVAGIGASMVDPSMIAVNVLGTAAIAKVGTSMAKGGRALNGIAKVSPASANMIVGAYREGATRSMMSIVAREGVENFLTSVGEETISHFADIGQERLARKIGFQDRLNNVIAGSVFGTGLGTVMTKEGRSGIARMFSRQHGDDAADIAQSMHTVIAQEVKMGVERSGIEAKFYDRETFQTRPWYGEQETQWSPATPNKLFLSVDKDGNLHSYSNRGSGTVLTDNKVHAYNKGSKIIEVDPANLNLITREAMVDVKGRHTKIGTQVMDELVEDIVAKADPDKLGKVLALMADSEADVSGVKLNRNQVRKALKQTLEGKHLDDIIDTIDGAATRHGLDYDPTVKLEEISEKLGFNGYVFTGKNAQGNGAYNGVYVSQKFGKKITKVREMDTPVPRGEGDNIVWKHGEQAMLKEYTQNLLTKAKPLKADLRDPDVAGIPKETPTDTPAKSIEAHAIVGSKEKLTKIQAEKAKIEAEITAQLESAKANQKPKKGEAAPAITPEEAVAPELLMKKKLIEMMESGKSKHEIIAEQELIAKDYVNCLLGV